MLAKNTKNLLFAADIIVGLLLGGFNGGIIIGAGFILLALWHGQKAVSQDKVDPLGLLEMLSFGVILLLGAFLLLRYKIFGLPDKLLLLSSNLFIALAVGLGLFGVFLLFCGFVKEKGD